MEVLEEESQAEEVVEFGDEELVPVPSKENTLLLPKIAT